MALHKTTSGDLTNVRWEKGGGASPMQLSIIPDSDADHLLLLLLGEEKRATLLVVVVLKFRTSGLFLAKLPKKKSNYNNNNNNQCAILVNAFIFT